MSLSYIQVWFGISEYAKTGKYLAGRMRSHPLVVKLGDGDAPAMRDLADVRMLELDDGFAKVQQEFGADLYKAADWRWVHDSVLRHAPTIACLPCTQPAHVHAHSIIRSPHNQCQGCRSIYVRSRPP